MADEKPKAVNPVTALEDLVTALETLTHNARILRDRAKNWQDENHDDGGNAA